MSKQREPEGQVIEVLPNNLYRVQMDAGREVMAYMSGAMRSRKISLLVGDRVEVKLDPYGGKTTNRIVWRIRS